MGRIRSVERRVFLAILAVALIPAAFTLAVGAFALSEGLARAGAGPWEDAAESGRVLLEAVEAGAGADSALLAAARRHRETLSASMRLARRYQFVTDSARRAVPAAALAFAVLITLLAALAARLVARGVAEPIRALVDWTERIARDEPLPATGPAADVREFAALEDALRRMAGELSAARSREVEAARLRSWTEMARRVAHELKNPLTPMRMAAATVARAADPALAEAGRVLVDEVARLDEMARSFSQFGRMPDGPAAPVDLVELLEGLTAPFGRTVTLHVPPGGAPHVHGHVDALGRVLRNLVVNALEAAEVHSGPDGARVHVALAADDEAVVVTVDDNGPGVPPELRDDIWSPDVTTKRRGTGLGLALVRQTVLHHGGTVHVGEAPGGGARFTVRLPLGGAAAEAEDPTGRSGASTPTETA